MKISEKIRQECGEKPDLVMDDISDIGYWSGMIRAARIAEREEHNQLMEDYSFQESRYGTHTVKVDFQNGKWKGSVYKQIGGNTKGFQVLSSVADPLFIGDEPFYKNDINLKVHDDDWFTLTLEDDKGNQCDFEVEEGEIEDMIVGVSIINFKPED